jgi:hypothetical protein
MADAEVFAAGIVGVVNVKALARRDQETAARGSTRYLRRPVAPTAGAGGRARRGSAVYEAPFSLEELADLPLDPPDRRASQRVYARLELGSIPAFRSSRFASWRPIGSAMQNELREPLQFLGGSHARITKPAELNRLPACRLVRRIGKRRALVQGSPVTEVVLVEAPLGGLLTPCSYWRIIDYGLAREEPRCPAAPA